ncbi:Gfo/Idh/MocA family oxidoreductase [Candidatus Pelagibacter sp.]|nr:Gfo/Idh/MocA family oxidoreductase [Candidatus Pelagibacter sp.]
MKKINIAIIGLGYWGTIVTNALTSMSLFKKIYINDTDLKKVSIIKKKFGSKVIKSDLNQIKNNEKIKHVFLATPPKENFAILKSLIKSKKNILIEKPGMTSLKLFDSIKKELKINRVKLSFGYIYIYNDYIRYLKKVIKSNKLGKIRYINLQRQNFGPIRNKVSAAFDLATHDISILYYLLNKKISLKSSVSHNILGKNNYDISFLNLKAGETNIDINVSWLNPEKIRKIIIIGSRKMLLFDEMNINEPIKIYNNYVSFPKIDKFSKNYFNQSKYIFKGKSKSIKIKDTKPLNNEILEFVKSKKNITNIDFSKNIIKTIKNL